MTYYIGESKTVLFFMYLEKLNQDLLKEEGRMLTQPEMTDAFVDFVNWHSEKLDVMTYKNFKFRYHHFLK